MKSVDNKNIYTYKSIRFSGHNYAYLEHPPFGRVEIEKLGFIFKRQSQGKEEYEFGNVWEASLGASGFLDYYPANGMMVLKTTDADYNEDGPNISVKLRGIVSNLFMFKQILKMTNTKVVKQESTITK